MDVLNLKQVARPRHLSKSPISEALIDLKVEFDELPVRGQFDPLAAALAAKYPGREEKRKHETKLEISPAGVKSEILELGFVGIFSSSQDAKTLIQSRVDGFTINRLAPYSTWAELLPEALSAWEHYAAALRPKSVSRAAVRYINQLRLPFKHGDEFKRFLTVPPEIPPSLPQHVSDFLTRTVTHESETETPGAVIAVTQRLQYAGDPEKSLFVLDIDVFRPDAALDLAVEPVRDTLEHLHALAERVFFEMLTEEALEVIE